MKLTVYYEAIDPYYSSQEQVFIGIDEESCYSQRDEFEEWLDMIVDERGSNADFSRNDEFFDYNQLGEDLEQDGYTFTTDGCICLY